MGLEEDDVLGLLLKLFLRFWSTKIYWRILIIVMTTLYVGTTIVLILDFRNEKTESKYMSYFFASSQIYILIVQISCLLKSDSIFQLLKVYREEFWCLAFGGSQFFQKILNGRKVLYFYLTILGTLMITMSLQYVLLSFQDNQLIYLNIYFEENFETYPLWCRLLVNATIFYSSGLLTAQALVVVYFTTHLKFQFCLLNELLLKISIGYCVNDYSLIQNQSYQKIIDAKLKAAIKHHVVLKRTSVLLSDAIAAPMVVQLIFGTVLTSLVVVIILWGFSEHVITLSTFLSFVLVFALINFLSGQLLTNESERCLESASRCPWNIWNSRNRSTLLMFMKNVKPVVISYKGVFALDNVLLKWYLKMAYTVLALLVKLIGKQK